MKLDFAINAVQVLLLLLLAPLVRGVIARLKARIQNRRGASVWRPYTELLKLFRKEDLVPDSASFVFRLAPIVLFAPPWWSRRLFRCCTARRSLDATGDFVLLVYLLALGRFFLMLGAMDGGSSFGGMGASREALVSTLAEAPFLLALMSVGDRGAYRQHRRNGAVDHGARLLSVLRRSRPGVCALALVAIAETGRIPVDNPTTHLELTMIHEAMVLEYSGPSLALIEWASAIKLTVVMALLIALFVPWGMAGSLSVLAIAIASIVLLLKMAALVLVLALVESSVAKLRMYLVPDFLGVASALAILAVVFTALMMR